MYLRRLSLEKLFGEKHIMPAVAQHKIREYLKEFSGGMTTHTMAEDLGILHGSLITAIKRMPDAYIDDWVWQKCGVHMDWVALWKVAKIPKSVPKPTHKPKE